MRTKRLVTSLVMFLTLTGWGLMGCIGGQAGDEGLDDDGGEGGTGGAAGEGGMGGDGGGVAGVGGTDAGGQSGASGVDGSVAPYPGTPIDGAGAERALCVIEIWESPDAEIEAYQCSLVGAAWSDESDAPGADNAEPMDWQCDCNGESRSAKAADCSEALESGCGVSQDDPETFCRDMNRDVMGVCWADGEQGWQCRCGDPAGDSDLVAQPEEVCEVALFNACAGPCDGLLGDCTPALDEDEMAFTCNCTYYGEIERPVATGWCENALQAACHPSQPDVDRCNGYVGYCDAKGEGYECRCLDGAEQSIASEDTSTGACIAALEEVCGENEPDEERVCETEVSEDGVEEQARCVDLGEGAYECNCETQIAASEMGSGSEQTDGASGAGADVSGSAGSAAPGSAGSLDGGIAVTRPLAGVGEPGEIRLAAACEQALILACPYLAEASAEQIDEACVSLVECYSVIEQDFCIEHIRDDCALCMLAAFAAGAACGDEALDSCLSMCVGLVPAPSSVEECLSVLDAFDRRTGQAECLCEECLDSFADCVVDQGCYEIADCAGKVGCSNIDCYAPDKCQDVINKWGISSQSVMLVQTLAACEAVPSCGGR